MNDQFEPVIVGFLCNWCAYAGGDLAGVSRIQYPANMRAIRVMCSGMVHPDLVADAFNQGADGIIVMGCHLGECHYLNGNYKALARSEIISIVLEESGIDPDRFTLKWVSSAEGPRFAELVTRFTEQIRVLGPHSPGEKPMNGDSGQTEAV